MDKFVDISNSKIRIKDIAERAKVSVGTVDRVLHNRGEVAKETRDLINRIIAELNYEPNIIASTLAQKKPFRIAVLMPLPAEQDSYWKSHLSGISSAIREISHFGVSLQKYFFEVSSEESFRLQYEQLLENEPDAVLMVPVFQESSRTLMQRLSDSNIPFAFLDSGSSDAGQLTFIGQDSFRSGYLAAKLMSYSVAKDATVLIINLAKDVYSEPHFTKRIQGFKAYLSDHNITEMKIRTIEIASNQEADVKKALTNAFLDYSFVRGMFVTGYEIHRVARFIDEKKLGNIRLIGYDLLESNVQYLKKGTIDFLISQKTESQGYKGVMTLFNHLVLKKPLPEQNSMPIDIITKENVEYYLYL